MGCRHADMRVATLSIIKVSVGRVVRRQLQDRSRRRLRRHCHRLIESGVNGFPQFRTARSTHDRWIDAVGIISLPYITPMPRYGFALYEHTFFCFDDAAAIKPLCAVVDFVFIIVAVHTLGLGPPGNSALMLRNSSAYGMDTGMRFCIRKSVLCYQRL